ncbi:MAG: hypothetical protein E6K55_05160 [Gemmatimonadetes bacterium]|nr:MAG: hypothetical protein DMD67_05810 [Gemmatimonadota bacterium]TLY54707.1 MAG: hypothetical protein E6K55_05160 [Gemmatimonadota bacterium]
MNGQRMAAYGAMGGAALGGFTWVVVAGALIHDPAIWASGAVLALAIWWGGARAMLRYPTRVLAVIGIVVLGVVLIDAAFLAVVLPRLPKEDAGLYFGTSPTAFRAIRPWLWIAGVAGPAVALWSLWRARKQP